MPPVLEEPRSRHARHLYLPRDDKGLALVAILLLAAILLALGMFGTRNTGIELRIAANDVNAKKALAVAEAGVLYAAQLIQADGDGFNDELTNGGTGGALVAIGNVNTLDGVAYRERNFGDGTFDVRLTDNFDEQAGANDATLDADGTVKLDVRGRVHAAERVLEAVLKRSSLFSAGLFGKNFVRFSGGGGLTDSYDSQSGDYPNVPHGENGDIMTNGTVTLSSDVTIHGDVTAVGTVSTSGGASVTGQISQNAPPVTVPLDPVQSCGPPYSTGSGISGVGSYSYATTGSSAGKLIASGGARVTLEPGTYCFSGLSFSGGSVLQVGGPVNVSFTGQVVFSGGGFANLTHIPSNLQVFSSYSGNNGISLSGGSDAYFAVYAPNAAVVVSGSGDLYGAIVGRDITATGGSKVHTDEGLLRGTSGRPLSWREVRSW